MYEQRKFTIFSTSELNQIDFDQVLETSIDTVRTSVDGTKTFVKWDCEECPHCLEELTTAEGPYTYEEMLDILQTEEWSNPPEEDENGNIL
jgi:hypothetical protein